MKQYQSKRAYIRKVHGKKQLVKRHAQRYSRKPHRASKLLMIGGWSPEHQRILNESYASQLQTEKRVQSNNKRILKYVPRTNELVSKAKQNEINVKGSRRRLNELRVNLNREKGRIQYILNKNPEDLSNFRQIMGKRKRGVKRMGYTISPLVRRQATHLPKSLRRINNEGEEELRVVVGEEQTTHKPIVQWLTRRELGLEPDPYQVNEFIVNQIRPKSTKPKVRYPR